jgi:hypothetical protein
MCEASDVARQGDQRWAVTLVVVLVVALGSLFGVAGIRLAQMRSTPFAFTRGIPEVGAGGPTLEVSADAWADANGAAVTHVFDRYFAAINAKNYHDWVATVSPEFAATKSQDAWQKGYATTSVGTIRLARIDAASAGRWVAMVSFISTQDEADGPNGAKAPRVCWRVSYPLSGSPLRIETPDPGDILYASC